MNAYERLFAKYEDEMDVELMAVLNTISAHVNQLGPAGKALKMHWGDYCLLTERTGIDLRKVLIKKSDVKTFSDNQKGQHIILSYKRYATHLYFDEQVSEKKPAKRKTKKRKSRCLPVQLIDSIEDFKENSFITPAQCVFIDTETTGLFAADHVIELAVVDDIEDDLFDSLLAPKRKRNIHPKALEAHGISQDRLAGKPRLIDVQADVEKQLRGKYAVFYNAGFDVEKMLNSSDGHIFDECLGVICLMKIYSDATNNGRWVKLVKACDEQNIYYADLPNHRASGDAKKLARLFKVFYPKLMAELDHTLLNQISYNNTSNNQEA